MLLRSPITPSPLRRSPDIPLRRPQPLLLLRRRRRRSPDLTPLSSLQDFISAFPSPDLILTPLLAFTSAAALLLSSRRPESPEDEPATIGDWVLFTSPTPFNRSVLLRCPSISFEEGDEVFDAVSERLVSRERHYVNLSRGRITTRGAGDGVFDFEYQRVCVGAEDGGVISLDWPDNLDLAKERGLDTTVIVVPGTVEGSMDSDVRLFVYEAVKHGFFPVVTNPRGCAGSPVTTARVFTAADSNDISTAVQFVSRLRPWTTMMSIGWGYGANMLTKYLAEVGEATPLTAAVCIDNPFDLEEATRSFPHHIALDKKLTSGLINILRANKELFQGKSKDFDVNKALSAKSVRDFDTAISMVPYGFTVVEDFYSQASSRQSISSLKIPVLFIQSDDGTVPLFSIPRSSIAENPFTSLLVCTCQPTTDVRNGSSAIPWCQKLAIEWFLAVELALLKGRHPLLNDVDVTINPTKDLTIVEDKSTGGSKVLGSYASDTMFTSLKISHKDGYVKIAPTKPVNGFLVDSFNNVMMQNGSAIDSKAGMDPRKDSLEMVNADDGGMTNNRNFDDLQTKGSDDSSEGEQVEDYERKMMQTTVVVMNMLDVTMPGALDEEQKKKVIAAVEKGETLMMALQGAVPEDVRGKLTNAVTEILQTQGKKLNLERLRKIGWIPTVTSEVKSKVEEHSGKDALMDSTYNTSNVSDVTHDGKIEADASISNSGGKSPPGMNEHSDDLRASQASGIVEDGRAVGSEIKIDQSEKGSDRTDESTNEQYKAYQNQMMTEEHNKDGQVAASDSINIAQGTKLEDYIEEPNTSYSSVKTEESISTGPQIPGNQEKEGTYIQKNDSKAETDQISKSPIIQSEEPSISTSNTPSISVVQAFDALTGFDDSTQMAVTSVFGVIEEMIDQYEKKGHEENSKTEDPESQIPGHHPFSGESNTKKMEYDRNRQKEDLNMQQLANNTNENLGEKESHHHGIELGDKEFTEGAKPRTGKVKQSEETQESAMSLPQFPSTSSLTVGSLTNIPLDVAVNPYFWGSPHAAYLQRYLSTKVPRFSSYDLDSATDLFLDPVEGQWKMLDQVDSNRSELGQDQMLDVNRQSFLHLGSKEGTVVEPSYVIMDGDFSNYEDQISKSSNRSDYLDSQEEAIMESIKKSLFDALKVEVGRKLGVPDLKEITGDIKDDLQLLAGAVTHRSLADCQLNLRALVNYNQNSLVKIGTLEGNHVVKIVSEVVKETDSLKKILPVGVIVGSVLASLRKYFDLAAAYDDNQKTETVKTENIQERIYVEDNNTRTAYNASKKDQHLYDKSVNRTDEAVVASDGRNGRIMVGAVTAALGASALLAQNQQKAESRDNSEVNSFVVSGKNLPVMENIKHEAVQEKNQLNLVSSLAEKAMSVAGPVVPTKGDGEVDEERLVAILAELGQKGGMLRLVGKVALLWGGIRGAMSLTDKLISFLRIAERPLFQRVIAFACMVLVLWSPVVIPLLPALVQIWTTTASNRIAEYCCIIGLYVAILILIMLWGKRIRGYDNPLDQYGVNPTVSMMHDFLKGSVGGMFIVMAVHSVGALLGYTKFSWPIDLPRFSAGPLLLLKAYGKAAVLSIQCAITAIGIALVEELLFRSWFPKEVSVDLGFYHGVMISAIAFSLIHRSLPLIPGLFMLSIALFGIKQRYQNKLSVPIGIRAGIMITNFTIQSGGFIKYNGNTPFWLRSSHPLHPFDNVVGLIICLLLSVIFFPRRPLEEPTGN